MYDFELRKTLVVVTKDDEESRGALTLLNVSDCRGQPDVVLPSAL